MRSAETGGRSESYTEAAQAHSNTTSNENIEEKDDGGSSAGDDFIPIDFEDDSPVHDPPSVFTASVLNPIWWIRFAFSTWATPLLRTGAKRTLLPDDMFGVLRRQRSADLMRRVDAAYVYYKKKGSQQPMIMALAKTHAGVMSRAGLALALEFSCAIMQAVTLGWLLHGMGDSATEERELYGYAAMIVAFTFMRTMLLHCGAMQQWFTGMELRAACIGMLFRKVHTLRAESMSHIPSGQIISLMTADVERFTFFWFFHASWLGPILLISISAIGYYQIGASMFVGLGLMAFMLPLQLFFGHLFGRLRRRTASYTDKRVGAMKDILHGIRGVKAAAWEKPFSRVVEGLRQSETESLRRTARIKSFNMTFFHGVTTYCTFAALMTFVATGGILTPQRVFTVLSLFGAVRLIAGLFLPAWIQIRSELKVTMERIQRVLDIDSTDWSRKHANMAYQTYKSSQCKANGDGTSHVVMPSISQPSAVHVDSLCAGWPNVEGNKEDTLKNLSFTVDFGELLLVCGPVGAGKSTLLLTLLGELRPSSGVVFTGNYPMLIAPQQPVVYSGTIKENILWGQPFNLKWYRRVVEACQLVQDIRTLDGGDGAMIGERGISLSGGQKARIGLARTVYAVCVSQQKCVVLLDDPFSAVDASVGQLLFTEVVKDLLKPHATIVVTHHVHYIDKVDRALGIGTGGEQLNSEEVQQMVHAHRERHQRDHTTSVSNQNEELPVKTDSQLSSAPDWQSRRRSASVVAIEAREEGALAFSSVWTYFTAAGSQTLMIATSLCMLVAQGLQVGVDFYLAGWAEESSNDQDDQRHERIRNFALIVIAFAVMNFIRGLLYMDLAVLSSKALHDKAFSCLMNTSQRFFDTQPVGRILNRFTKDVGYIDDLLPDTGMDVFTLGLLCIASVASAGAVNPYVLIVIVPCVIGFFWLRQFYIKTSRDIKRIEGTERSPLYAHLSVAIDGLPLLRCFPGALAQNLSQFQELQDRHSQAWMTFVIMSRWMGSRLDLIVLVLMAATAFLAVAQRDNLDPGVVGLSLAYIMQLTGVFQWAVRQSAEMENQLTSVERLVEYAKLEPEGDRVGCAGMKICSHQQELLNQDLSEWKPTAGRIEIKNLSIWYDDPQNTRLIDINLTISAGSKVGVVGRTGAGKSSLISALLRLAPTSGLVLIDQVPTCALSLETLRHAINLIPQDPALFSGTIRKNLDPFNEHDDVTLWDAIEAVQLSRTVKALGGMNAEVTEFGSNFSVGERQLICLARAIIKPTKILVMDEATANVDSATDATIQAVLRTKFSQCTVLTIAHRLGTVLDSDFVLVMDDGKVLEYGTPKELLSKSDVDVGSFKSLYTASQNAVHTS